MTISTDDPTQTMACGRFQSGMNKVKLQVERLFKLCPKAVATRKLEGRRGVALDVRMSRIWTVSGDLQETDSMYIFTSPWRVAVSLRLSPFVQIR